MKKYIIKGAASNRYFMKWINEEPKFKLDFNDAKQFDSFELAESEAEKIAKSRRAVKIETIYAPNP